MKEIIIASNNQNKIKELKKILTNYQLLSLNDVNIDIDVEETGKTFYENALIKAQAIYDLIHKPVIADDSGIILDELKDWPGIHTKRICPNDSHKRNQMIIDKSKELTSKKVTAICALVYVDELGTIKAIGKMHGEVTDKEYLGNGFGFDSIFKLKNGKVVSELNEDEKNKISHRYLASVKLKKLLDEKRP